MTSRAELDANIRIHGDTRVGRIIGTRHETITIEQWNGDLHYDPVVLIHGPYGAEKYRFAATGAELVQFARDVLTWADAGRQG